MLRRCHVLREVLFKDFPAARQITLNREKALNAVNTKMIEELATLHLVSPHADPNAIIVLKGAGSKAFCAGGDVVSIVQDTPAGTQQEFFYKEYQVNYAILTMQRKQFALWDGIVMGGGVGLSVHGSHRIASERALFAMPETGIGLFPDVGGSWFLPRLPNPSVGLYLSLTGRRLKGADLVHAGIATHFVPSAAVAALEEALLASRDATDAVSKLMDVATNKSSLAPFSLEADLPLIEEVFRPERTVEEMMHLLLSSGKEMGTGLAQGLQKCSPISLKVSLELFRRGAKISNPHDIFKMEYVATQRAMKQGDFSSGVRALLIDKTNKPIWNPAKLEEVTSGMVESYFQQSPSTPVWSATVPFAKALSAVSAE